jgi:NAD(P)-dependent dehydrogenase (short-subunit alcohol dehydrogenase family)
MATPQEQHTRVALVTGAAQGIGRAIALRLANDGLDVAVNDLPGKIDSLNAVVEEIRSLGRRAFAVTSDVSKEDEVKAMVEAAVSALGRLDVVRHNAFRGMGLISRALKMVANAGIAGSAGSVMDGEPKSVSTSIIPSV